MFWRFLFRPWARQRHWDELTGEIVQREAAAIWQLVGPRWQTLDPGERLGYVRTRVALRIGQSLERASVTLGRLTPQQERQLRHQIAEALSDHFARHLSRRQRRRAA